MEFGIVWLIRAAWITAILPMVIALIPSSKLRFFHDLVLGFAGRGKILQPSSQKLTVPQKFFVHFYVIGVVWTALLLATTWMYGIKMAPLTSEEFQFSNIASHITGGSHIFSFNKSHSSPMEHRFKVWRAVFLLLLMEIQVLRRLIESVYIFNYSSSARMHILGYLTGLFFYTAAPLSLCSNVVPEVAIFAGNQVAEFIAKGKSHTSTPKFDIVVSISPLMKLGSLQLIGAAIFLWGWIHQRRCHAILVGNLTLAAGETHRWYLRKFENYPVNRSAIFPYLY